MIYQLIRSFLNFETTRTSIAILQLCMIQDSHAYVICYFHLLIATIEQIHMVNEVVRLISSKIQATF